VSTYTHFAHKAWHDTSPAIGKIEYTMVGDPTHALSRNFDVLIEAAGLADRGTFVVDPDGKIQIVEITAGGIGLVEGGLVDARDQFATIEEGLAKTALPPVAGMPLPRVAGYLRGSHPVWSEQRLAGALSAFDVNLDGTVAWRLTDARSEALFRSLWETSVADSWPAVHVPAVVAVAAMIGRLQAP